MNAGILGDLQRHERNAGFFGRLTGAHLGRDTGVGHLVRPDESVSIRVLQGDQHAPGCGINLRAPVVNGPAATVDSLGERVDAACVFRCHGRGLGVMVMVR
jgi:hypothetical protein